MLTQKQSVRERIVEAADQLIREKGLTGATTREIARAAGCAEGSIYVHFADKPSLVLATLLEGDSVLPELLRFHERAGERTVQANLEEQAEGLISFLELKLPCYLSLLADPDMLERHAAPLREQSAGPFAMVATIERYIRLEQKLGRVTRSVDPATVASIFIGACRDHVIAGRMLGTTPTEPQAFARSLVRTLVKGLTPRA